MNSVEMVNTMFSPDKLEYLLSHDLDSQGLCVSVYLPAPRQGGERVAAPRRLLQLLDNVETELIARGYRVPDARQLLLPARALPIDARADFGQRLEGSLAIFLTKGTFLHWWLPMPVDEQISIGQHFAIRPLLPLLVGDGAYYVLALSENQHRCISCTRDTWTEVSLPGAPQNLAETLRYDEVEKQLQQHSVSSGGRAYGASASMFHGQGDAGDAAIQRKQLVPYLRAIDDEVCKAFRTTPAPLVLAASEAIQGYYRANTHYPTLVEKGIIGNPDHRLPTELQQLAWEFVAPVFSQSQQQALANFSRLYHRDAPATRHDWRLTLLAAYSQQVETLFMPSDAELWGTFDPVTTSISIHPTRQSGDEDLANLTAIYTLRASGTVYVLPADEMPEQLPVAAILYAAI